MEVKKFTISIDADLIKGEEFKQQLELVLKDYTGCIPGIDFEVEEEE